MRRAAKVFWLAIIVALAANPIYVFGQTQPYPESVFFDPGPGGAAIQFARPSQTVGISAHGISMYIAPEMELKVPDGLSVRENPVCTSQALLDTVGSSNQNAPGTGAQCYLSIVKQAEYTVVRARSSEVYQPVLSYSVFLDIYVTVPADAVAGLIYTIEAPVAGLNGETESLRIEVLNEDGSKSPVMTTPTAPADVRIQPPASTGSLIFLPEVVEAAPGESVTFTLSVPRSATWDLERIAYLVWADQSQVRNVEIGYIDDDGQGACTAGTADDDVAASARAYEVGREHPLPNEVEVIVGHDAVPGDELLVCVELVGFGQGRELFSWNSFGVIAVIEP